MKTVILAGGKGTRLKPYSTVFPKPLMPIGDTPILEIIIRQLKARGLTDIVVAVGHLGELIMNFFGDGSKWGVNIGYCREEEPLGTAGALGLLKKDLTETFLVINGDTLTTLDYAGMAAAHEKSGAALTIALSERDTHVDFAVAEMDGAGTVTAYTEKPTFHHTVSMGIYVCQPEVLDRVTPGERLDFPDLTKTLMAQGKPVKGYLFGGYWLDIGQPSDYEKANEEIDDIYPKLFNQ